MPQLFHVLRCYICSVFQVHQTNKSNKWVCKVCGEKQSVKRFYGLGTAKECRFQVQKLNGMRGEINEQKKNIAQESVNQNEETVTKQKKYKYIPVKDSKWAYYVEETEDIEENTNEVVSLEDTEVVVEVPNKRRKLNDSKQFVSSVMAPSTSISVGSIQTNLRQPSFNSEDLIAEEQQMNKKHDNVKKFIAPEINKNSKWAQFTEEPDETEHTDNISPSHNKDETHDLFAWCDEPDLDFILDV